VDEPGAVRGLVMELAGGEDLSAIVGRGPLALPDALAIARQLGDALEAAPEHGIVHRDLKPANAKVSADGMVKRKCSVRRTFRSALAIGNPVIRVRYTNAKAPRSSQM
jgi:serine/threonine-protein kinase